MKQVNKEWGDMSKDPGIWGPLGGLYTFFPKKYNEKCMYQIFTTELDIK